MKGGRERSDPNMVMSVMCKKINEDGKDHPKSAGQLSRELTRANLDFSDGIKKI